MYPNKGYFLIFLINFHSLIVTIEPFCLGLLCSYVPLVSKTCCGVFESCCVQYQAWLAPLVGSDDLIGEYVEAMASEAIGDVLPEVVDKLDIPERVIMVTESAPEPVPWPSNNVLASLPRPYSKRKNNIFVQEMPYLAQFLHKRRSKVSCPECWHDKK